MMAETDLVGHPAHDERVRQLQEAMLVELGELNDAPLPPGMVLRHDERELIVTKPLVTQVRRVPGQEPEPDIHPPFLQRGFNFGGGNLLDRQADSGMFGREQTEQVGH